MENIQERMAEAYQWFGFLIYGSANNYSEGRLIISPKLVRGCREIAKEMAKYPLKVLSKASIAEAGQFAEFLGKTLSDRNINYYKVEVID